MGNTIKNLPVLERPYEKCIKYGPKCLSDTELVAIILKSGTKDKTSIELAREVLKKSDNTLSIHSLCKKSLDELTQIDGIGPVKGLTLKCIAEISERIVSSTFSDGIKFNSPKVIAEYYMERFRFLDHEEFCVIFLNSANILITERVITKGTIRSSMVSAREIFINALSLNAVNIILLHNHPSGDSSPSEEDKRVTSTVVDAGKLLNINVLDHIIIGDKKYFSFLEYGLL